jgi:hypothetical protein
MTDLYVPGLDLSTGLAVDAVDRNVWEWRRKGHNGDGTLVCLECYQGDGRPTGLGRSRWCRGERSAEPVSRSSRARRA